MNHGLADFHFQSRVKAEKEKTVARKEYRERERGQTPREDWMIVTCEFLDSKLTRKLIVMSENEEYRSELQVAPTHGNGPLHDKKS